MSEKSYREEVTQRAIRRPRGRPPVPPEQHYQKRHISFPPGMVEELERVATERGVPLSQVVQEAVEVWRRARAQKSQEEGALVAADQARREADPRKAERDRPG